MMSDTSSAAKPARPNAPKAFDALRATDVEFRAEQERRFVKPGELAHDRMRGPLPPPTKFERRPLEATRVLVDITARVAAGERIAQSAIAAATARVAGAHDYDAQWAQRWTSASRPQKREARR
jgi:predicted phage gp36 major capsid-like protein